MRLNSRVLYPYKVPTVFVSSDASNHAFLHNFLKERENIYGLKISKNTTKFDLEGVIRSSVCPTLLRPKDKQ